MLIVFTGISLAALTLNAVSTLAPVPHIAVLLLYLLLYALLSPLCIGMLGYHIDLFRAAVGDGPSNVMPTVIFAPYAQLRTAARAWIQMLSVILTGGMLALSALPMVFIFTRPAGRMTAVSVLGVLASILLFLFVLYLAARLSPSLFFSIAHPEEPYPRAVRRAWRATRTSVSTAVLLWLWFLAGVLCSVFLTAGIALFLYVLPVSFFTYISYCHVIVRREQYF